MKPSVAAALIALCFAPVAARAQPAEAPTVSLAPTSAMVVAPAAPPAPARVADADWSLGAGVSFGYFSLGGYVLRSSSMYSVLSTAPEVQASVERRTGPGRWTVFGVAGSASRSRGEAPAGSYEATRQDASSLAISAGVRRALTPEGAPVCVSTLWTASAGYLWRRQDVQYVPPRTVRSEAWGVGASLGLAVERELTPGLAVRLSTPIVGASWYRASSRSDVVGTSSLDGGGVSLGLAPSLELRLAF